MVRRRRWLIAALALGAVILTAGACASDGQKEIVETWIAEEGSYPTRTVVSFSLDESEFFFAFAPSQSIRLQMDITDADIDVEIEPPE